ncbi:bifunctional lysylphosphatidylglycerol flippase/synthetase MprF [Solwaraspora sp. WMMB335]|uniref:bifunctional lysylphosphatidylglycerol flippase/synthetase MprF n=1 Tax=Solwaraspora sp. WMMB335 TaxID=3404118 RepID=UPI003B96461B
MTGILTTGNPALHAIRTYTSAENPSSFLAVSEGNRYFQLPGHEGVIVYRRSGRFLVQFGGPFAPAASYRPLLDGFVAMAREEGLEVVSVQVQQADAPIYADRGFTVNQVGASWARSLADFSLRGTKFMQLRNKISRALRAGLVISEATDDRWFPALREIDQVWLRDKGEHARPLEYLVGQYGDAMQPHRRMFIGFIDEAPVGYISYSPVFGSRSGWMHDLSRRLPSRLPGIMEAINVHAIETFRTEGSAWLHFGFTPFSGLRRECELPGHDRGFRRLMELLWHHGEAVYPAQSQLAYKDKWAPDLFVPEYVAFHGSASIAGFAHIFRASNAF